MKIKLIGSVVWDMVIGNNIYLNIFKTFKKSLLIYKISFSKIFSRPLGLNVNLPNNEIIFFYIVCTWILLWISYLDKYIHVNFFI